MFLSAAAAATVVVVVVVVRKWKRKIEGLVQLFQ